jgi:regulator of replication initiation timing
VRHSHTGAGPSEATGLGTEIDALRVMLADLVTERSRVGAEAEKLRDDLSKAEASLGPLLQSSAQEEQQLEAMRAENDRLRSDLESLLQQLAKLNSLTATVPAPVSPLAPAASQPLGSQKPSPSFSSGFDHSLAVGDSGFGESNGFEDQPAASAADFHSGFEADTGFDSFGAGSSLPATADGDGFASGFGSDGFDSFSASASPAAAVASPDSAFASDGFGAFGASPSPAAASASSGDKSSAFNAFDAFDF